MKITNKIFVILTLLSFPTLALADQFPFFVQVPPEQNIGGSIGQGMSNGMMAGMASTMANARAAKAARNRQAIVASTKDVAISAWVGGPCRICKACYDSNLPLRQRVEMTTLLAIQLQDEGYGLIDSVETAKTAVEVNMGACYIPVCSSTANRE